MAPAAPDDTGPPPPAEGTVLAFVVQQAEAMEAWLDQPDAAADPGVFVARLMTAGQLALALRCIAVAIPTRQAVWWAWMTCRQAMAVQPAPPRIAALHDMIEQWIAAPDDSRRRAIWKAAQVPGIKHPVTLTAAAIWFSGPSLAEPSAAPVPPPPGMVGNFVSAAVSVAVLGGDPAALPTRSAAAVAQGLDVITRLGGWETSVSHVRREQMPAQDTSTGEVQS